MENRPVPAAETPEATRPGEKTERFAEKEALDLIAAQLEARRHKLEFVRSELFFGAGGIAAAVTTADYIVRQTTGRGHELLLVLAGLLVSCVCMVSYYRRHRTVTLNDRTLMNVWGYSVGVCSYIAAYASMGEEFRLPVLGMICVGLSIAAGVTGELFRRDAANKSQQSGSLVAFLWLSIGGAFLTAWILRAAATGQDTLQFILTLAAIALLLTGTGALLRYNERRGRV